MKYDIYIVEKHIIFYEMNGILLAQELYVEGTMNNYHQQVTRERKRGVKVVLLSIIFKICGIKR